MRKYIVLTLALLMSAGAFAQKGEMSISLTGNYFRASHNLLLKNNKDHFGVGLRFAYGITDGLRVAPGINYFFKSERLTAYNANIDFHYLIPVMPRLTVYPILGATMIHKKENATTVAPEEQTISIGYNGSEWGANLGAGVQFDLDRNWFVHADYIYKWVDGPERSKFSSIAIERSNLSLGVGFRF